jgi:hypothetical protein
MLRMVAFCRPLVAALALCTAAVAASVSPASARPYHRPAHYAHAYVSHPVRWHNVQLHSRHHYRYVRRQALQASSPGYAFASPALDSTTRIIRYKSRPSYRRASEQAARKQAVVAVPTRGFVESSAVPNTGGVTFEGPWAVRPWSRRRSTPLSRRQSDRPRQPVVRALHEHGAAAYRPPWAPAPTWRTRSPVTERAFPDRRSAPSLS